MSNGLSRGRLKNLNTPFRNPESDSLQKLHYSRSSSKCQLNSLKQPRTGICACRSPQESPIRSGELSIPFPQVLRRPADLPRWRPTRPYSSTIHPYASGAHIFAPRAEVGSSPGRWCLSTTGPCLSTGSPYFSPVHPYGSGIVRRGRAGMLRHSSERSGFNLTRVRCGAVEIPKPVARSVLFCAAVFFSAASADICVFERRDAETQRKAEELPQIAQIHTDTRLAGFSSVPICVICGCSNAFSSSASPLSLCGPTYWVCVF